MDKRGVYLIFGLIFLINAVAVLADNPFLSLVDTLKEFDLGAAYNRSPTTVESIFYLVLFVSLGVVASKKAGWDNKQGKTVFVMIGIFLAITTTIATRKYGLTFESLSEFILILLVLALAVGLYYLLRLLFGANTENKSGALSIALLISFFFADMIIKAKLGNSLSYYFTRMGIPWLYALIYVILIVVVFSSIPSLFKSMRGTANPTFSDGAGNAFESGMKLGNRVADAWNGRKFWKKDEAKSGEKKPDGKTEVKPEAKTENKSESKPQAPSFSGGTTKPETLPLAEELQVEEDVMEKLDQELGEESNMIKIMHGAIDGELNKDVLSQKDLIVTFERAKNESDKKQIFEMIKSLNKKTIQDRSDLAAAINHIQHIHKDRKNEIAGEMKLLENEVPAITKSKMDKMFAHYFDAVNKYYETLQKIKTGLENRTQHFEARADSMKLLNAQDERALRDISMLFHELKKVNVSEATKFIYAYIKQDLPRAIFERKVDYLGTFHIRGQTNRNVSLLEVPTVLAKDESAYHAHIGEGFNHFAQWAAAKGENDLANHIAKMRSRQDLVNFLNRYIRSYGRRFD